jgi:hypothetical protein
LASTKLELPLYLFPACKRFAFGVIIMQPVRSHIRPLSGLFSMRFVVKMHG